MTRTIAAVIVSVFGCSLGLSAQNADVKAPIALPAPQANPGADYRLGAGDLIEIRVFGVSNFYHTLRISAAGTIKLPLIDPVVAAGLTSTELERALTKMLDGDVIKDPQVSVFVKEYRSQPVTVLGAVRTPGQFQISVQLRLVDVLSLAGGLLPNAGDEAIIQRPSNGSEDEMIRVDLRQLLERGDLSLNSVVRGGDVIHIRERPEQYVYIVGELNRGGAFPIPAKQDVRVSQVFAWAGGASRTANADKSVLLRYDQAGQRQEVKVNFQDVLKGKQEDFLVRANDIIFVPGSKMKAFGQSLLAGLPGSIATIPYRIP